MLILPQAYETTPQLGLLFDPRAQKIAHAASWMRFGKSTHLNSLRDKLVAMWARVSNS